MSSSSGMPKLRRSSILIAAALIPAASAEERAGAWEPDRTLASIELDGPYEARPVAAEPLVFDPVEIAWDATGSAYVADMIDYPLGGPGGKHLSRIQKLIDANGDGVFDRAETFASDLDHPQGLLPHRGGLIVTTRTQVLFLEDKDGDGTAEIRQRLIAGFNPSFSQLQVSSPRWGPDGDVYFNNGLDTTQVHPVKEGAGEARKIDVARHNLRWDPQTGAVHPASGFGQYGGGFDDWGRHYFSSNRSPVMFAVVPYETTTAGGPREPRQPWEDIVPHGPDSRLFPLQITHTTSDAHSGTNTSACGLTVYRGDLMPELRGGIFVCDPTGQLITRFRKPEPAGSSLKSGRVGELTEFFRSRDEWCRPVNLTTGPDGALYVCDIYRQYIDHARFFPDDFVKKHDMRSGEHHGRIWKIVPKGANPRAITAASEDIPGLITWLTHENAWQRETAQRVLREKASDPGSARAIVAALAASKPANALGKLHTLWLHATLASRLPGEKAAPLLALTEGASPELAENIVLIAHRYPGYFGDRTHEIVTVTAAAGGFRARMLALAGTRAAPDGIEAAITSITNSAEALEDPWFQNAVLIHLQGHSGRLVSELLKGPYASSPSSFKTSFLRELAAAATKDRRDLHLLLESLRHQPGELLWWKPALLEGLALGLPQSGLGLLSAFAADPPPPEGDIRSEIPALLAQAGHIISDPAAPIEVRLACIPLLSQQAYATAGPVLKILLSGTQAAPVSEAAFTILRRYGAPTTAPLLYEILPGSSPSLRKEIITILGNDPGTLPDLLERMDRGEVPKSLVDAEARWRFLQSPDEKIKALASKLFERPASDRVAVIESYQPATTAKGDPGKGGEVFSQLCTVCHSYQGRGIAVGPDISDVRAKDKAALLNDILDPNRMIEARWSAYRIETRDGRTLVGIVAAESAASVVLKMPGGLTETIARADITRMGSLDASLMPVGLEAGISIQQMADLLAFLRGETATKP
ncbi:PVC-type heme-binding CxxCH protein [Luteolibacter sp. Populi]|uniref:PVC-type heme-binding CxxCH protein n=1 Tax=Luteolibacter sp. Populi TaxID=3230487 RepID=UPI003466BD19